MQKNTLAEINYYWMRSNAAAKRFQFYKGRIPALKRRFNNYLEKYRELFADAASRMLPLVLVVPAHLAVGLVEGLMVALLFKELIRGSIPSGWPLTLAASLVILVFWGWSIIIGHCFNKANVRRHDLEPRVAFNRGFLLAGALLTVGYLFFLYKLIEAGKEMAPGNEAKIQVIFFLGVAEVCLSFFAVQGVEVIWVNLKKWILEKRLLRHEWKMRQNALECEKSYRFYSQRLKQFNQDNGELFDQAINDEIQEALKEYN